MAAAAARPLREPPLCMCDPPMQCNVRRVRDPGNGHRNQ